MTDKFNSLIATRLVPIMHELSEEFAGAGIIVLVATPADDKADVSDVAAVMNVDRVSFIKILEQIIAEKAGVVGFVAPHTLN